MQNTAKSAYQSLTKDSAKSKWQSNSRWPKNTDNVINAVRLYKKQKDALIWPAPVVTISAIPVDNLSKAITSAWRLTTSTASRNLSGKSNIFSFGTNTLHVHFSKYFLSSLLPVRMHLCKSIVDNFIHYYYLISEFSKEKKRFFKLFISPLLPYKEIIHRNFYLSPVQTFVKAFLKNWIQFDNSHFQDASPDTWQFNDFSIEIKLTLNLSHSSWTFCYNLLMIPSLFIIASGCNPYEIFFYSFCWGSLSFLE